ncbi:MAG: DMT family transporter [Actinobacteria bacterium]|nr:DMT family transporter [Actinomycetota bacterium]
MRAANASLIAVTVAWASAFSVIKVLLDHGHSAIDVAILRYAVATPGFALLLWRMGWLPRLRRGDALRILAAALLIVVGYHVSLNVGTQFTSSGTAALVVALAPALTLVLAVRLGLERLVPARVAGLAVAFAGVIVVTLLGAGEDISFAAAKGPLIVLGAPASFALYNVLMKPLLARYNVFALTAAAGLAGMVLLLPFVRASTARSVTDVTAGDAVLVLYLGIVCTLLGYIAWNIGLRGLGASRAVVYAYAVPALAVVFGALFLDESVTAWLALGGLLIVGGVALAQRGQLPRLRSGTRRPACRPEGATGRP